MPRTQNTIEACVDVGYVWFMLHMLAFFIFFENSKNNYKIQKSYMNLYFKENFDQNKNKKRTELGRSESKMLF